MMATGLDASTKLGAYLSLGCLTPRQIHAALEASDRRGGQGEGDPESAASDEADAVAEGAACLKMHLQIRYKPRCHL